MAASPQSTGELRMGCAQELATARPTENISLQGPPSSLLREAPGSSRADIPSDAFEYVYDKQKGFAGPLCLLIHVSRSSATQLKVGGTEPLQGVGPTFCIG